jgi:hypothetical protein
MLVVGLVVASFVDVVAFEEQAFSMQVWLE